MSREQVIRFYEIAIVFALIVGFFLGFLAGSANFLHSSEIERAIEICASNGGLEKVSNERIVCVNGGAFYHE